MVNVCGRKEVEGVLGIKGRIRIPNKATVHRSSAYKCVDFACPGLTPRGHYAPVELEGVLLCVIQ